ncbi:GtrA family protein [Treponema zioleckii]|uniref:GtrA family protein n=1 Tax=Treponema zioleckii TaxID=331680 RepID=UPI00168A7DE1
MSIKDLFFKYKSFIAYTFFGICTTLVNLLCYRCFFHVLSIQNVPSTVLAWFFAVLFAFVTNKIWVFESKTWCLSIVCVELIKFFLCRIATGLIDVGVMWFAVDKMQWNAMLWKFISNIIVILLNYIASKMIIFQNRNIKGNI